MSNMSRFVYECQEIAENNPFVSTNELKALVKKQFADRPVWMPCAVETTLDCAKQIQNDMESVA